jgi:hypothetical protein
MIQGVHALVYSPQAAEVRAFLADVIGLTAIDPSLDWPIFSLPPAELGIHPTDGAPRTELYLLTSDIDGTIDTLRGRGIEIVNEPADRDWGRVAGVRSPDGSTLWIYQPRHRSVLGEAAE